MAVQAGSVAATSGKRLARGTSTAPLSQSGALGAGHAALIGGGAVGIGGAAVDRGAAGQRQVGAGGAAVVGERAEQGVGVREVAGDGVGQVALADVVPARGEGAAASVTTKGPTRAVLLWAKIERVAVTAAPAPKSRRWWARR